MLDIDTPEKILGRKNGPHARTVHNAQSLSAPAAVCGLVVHSRLYDRINVSFAGLTMRGDLEMSAGTFGFAAGLFYWGYFIFEVPSNVILERVGARVWIARIMITWGILAGLTALVTDRRASRSCASYLASPRLDSFLA